MLRLFRTHCCRLFLIATLGFAPTVTQAEEIGFIENFALARDRAEVLPQLIPDTEDYFYYHVLFYQSMGKVADAQAMLSRWVDKLGWSELARRMEGRQMMLTYSTNREQTVQYLISQLNVNLSHTPPQRDRASSMSTKLDGDLVDYAKVLKRVIEEDRNLTSIEDIALFDVVPYLQDMEDLRAWLSRLRRVDIPGVVEFIVKELRAQGSAGFGWATIHAQLTLAQMQELGKAMPDLYGNDRFVQVYLQRLKPDGDVSLDDREVMREYLQRLEQFVQDLPDSQRNITAAVLYRRLDFDRQQGIFDRERFVRYLQYPRNVWYYNPISLRERNGVGLIDLGADFRGVVPELPPIGDDSALIREYLEHFFQADANVDAFKPWIDLGYLETVFAETKILYGIDDARPHYARLGPGQQKEIKERVELKFAKNNAPYYEPNQAVQLELELKNVPELTIKIYRINARNILKQNNGVISTDIDLDGLVANEQKSLIYSLPTDRRHRESIALPELEGRGIWIVDFLGGGQRSRVLVQKGQLRSLQRYLPAGIALRIINERGEPVPDAHAEIGERVYKPDESGSIFIPYGEQTITAYLLLVADRFANYELMMHPAEVYKLESSFLTEPQGLLSGARAKVVIRPQLLCNQQPVPLSELTDVSLSVEAVDIDGITTTQVLEDQKLQNDEEFVHEFLVPQRLSDLSFTLKGKVRNRSLDIQQELTSSYQAQVNQLNRTAQLGDFYLQKHADGFALYALGRNGEPFRRLPIRFQLKVRGVSKPVSITLATDENGACDLGRLADVITMNAECDFLKNRGFQLWAVTHDWPARLHQLTEESVEVPFGGAQVTGRVSLLEYRGGQVYEDHTKSIELFAGSLRIKPLRRGDYVLHDHLSGQMISIAVAEGKKSQDILQGNGRFLEPHRYRPAFIREARVEAGKLRVKLAEGDAWTRVHVVASAFDNRASLAGSMRLSHATPYVLARSRTPTLFVESLKLDEEYQYIMGRSKQSYYPGILLAQPSVLLNPWDLSATENDRRDANAGDPMAAKAAPAPPAPAMMEAENAAAESQSHESTSYEFLGEGALVATNLTPNQEGVVEFDVGQLDGRTSLQILVVHPTAVVAAETLLPPARKDSGSDWSLADQRLNESFGADTHRAERQSIRKLKSGEWVDLGDARTTRVKTYSRLSDLYTLFGVILGESSDNWEKFRVLTDWDELTEKEKGQAYDELASHEMHLFLYFKDRPFFERLVRPYLANKLDKQIVDQWLLGEDISEFGVAWRFERLNALEKVLVSRAVEAKREAVERFLKDWIGANPVDPLWRRDRFSSGLLSSVLGGEAAGVMIPEELARSEKRLSPGRVGGGGMGGMGGRVPEVADGPMGGVGGLPGAGAQELDASSADGEAGSGRAEDKAAGLRRNQRGAAADYFAFGVTGADEKKQLAADRFFQSVQATKKWTESHYFRRAKESGAAGVVPHNAFWLDYLKHKAEDGAFLSENIDLPTATLHEAIIALAVTDLPFRAEPVELSVEGGRLRARSGSDSLAFVQAIELLEAKQPDSSLLVGQDVYLGVGSEPLERPVPNDAMVRGIHYQARIVVTNPTNMERRVQVLAQIPQGSIAISGGKTSRNWPVVLGPYSSQQLAFDFYFPEAGQFELYGAQISDEKGFISSVASRKLEVLSEPKNIDTTTWEYVSDWGTADEVLAFLKSANLRKIDLSRIAFRMQDKSFYERTLELLSNAGVYQDTLWSYSLKHLDDSRIREYVEHRDDFMRRLGPSLPQGLVQLDPVERSWFEHLDFRPLIVARVHQLGGNREILNQDLLKQYRELLGIISGQDGPSSTQKLEIVYYMILQNRVAEAIEWFDSISKADVPSKLQYDYFDAYLSMCQREYAKAAEIAGRYAEYPEPRWQSQFAEMVSQVQQRQELLAQGNTTVKKEGSEGIDAREEDQRVLIDSRERQQSELAKRLPTLDLQWKGGELTLSHRNQDMVRVNYYQMDIELLFSRSPFVQQDSRHLTLIEPNYSEVLDLKGRGDVVSIAIPEKLKNSNMLVEVVGGGLVRTQSVYANSLEVLPSETLGRLQVFLSVGRSPLEGTYVKVYARHSSGEIRFFKDGYTDLRGEFDYASLSTNDLLTAQKFSILVIHPEHGALIMEVEPPKR
jgi:hypothetical protein